MHTYLRYDSVLPITYTVGIWLPNREGVTSFVKLFDVDGRAAAITAVNMLNGGDTSQKFKVLKEH